ncbi:hypothetical protein [Nonomuraea sp. NPDC049784]|uniref:hypothetical protein n=1 Tax=Nonomuraea sp. NPDC049784 TaxID=3154361 RepID=UPI0033F73C91
MVILQRDGWRLEIAFDGHAPKEATANEPGHNVGRQLNLRSINDFVHQPRTDRLTRPCRDRGQGTCRTSDHEAGEHFDDEHGGCEQDALRDDDRWSSSNMGDVI